MRARLISVAAWRKETERKWRCILAVEREREREREGRDVQGSARSILPRVRLPSHLLRKSRLARAGLNSSRDSSLDIVVRNLVAM